MSWFNRLRPAPEMRRIIWIWLILSVIITPLMVIFVGPLLPPGAASSAAYDQQFDNIVMMGIVIPIIIALAVYFTYVLRNFRHRGGALVDGPHVQGSGPIIGAWLTVTLSIVIFLAAWGSYELFPGEAGAGGGEGPRPLAVSTPPQASRALTVQVIGQQWAWTFRYPSYGGVETTDLVLPVGREIRFVVTSIDVIHSFWAYELGVKADAVPNTVNIAFSEPKQVETSQIRCAELCGLWHGHMYTTLRVVSQSQFRTWINQQRSQSAPISHYLPKYSPTYAPSPTYRAT